MSQVAESAAGEAVESPIRWKWLKAMYIINLLVALPLGLGVLFAPETMREILGVPAGNPALYGMATGALPLGFGLAGALGLRFPLKLSPVLALQALYKSLFLIGVVVPLIAVGQLPSFAVPLSLLFLVFIVGDLIAVPFSHLFSQPASSR